jgi:heme A synthase
MRITKIELLLIFDQAIISGLLFYIVQSSIRGAILCFVLVLIIQLIFYYLVWKIKNRMDKTKTKMKNN